MENTSTCITRDPSCRQRCALLVRFTFSRRLRRCCNQGPLWLSSALPLVPSCVHRSCYCHAEIRMGCGASVLDYSTSSRSSISRGGLDCTISRRLMDGGDGASRQTSLHLRSTASAKPLSRDYCRVWILTVSAYSSTSF